MSFQFPTSISGVGVNIQLSMGEADRRIMFDNLSVRDIYLEESLLSPATSIIITITDRVHLLKNYFKYRICNGDPVKCKIELKNPFKGEDPLTDDVIPSEDDKIVIEDHVIYRMDSRKLNANYHTEDYNLYLCPETTFKNLKARMSDFYRRKSLNTIVQDALSAAGITNHDVESTQLRRNYITNNQHPFQVISDISEMAYKSSGGDIWTQYLHYMTFEEKKGKHYWKSLDSLINGSVKKRYVYHEKGLNRQRITDDGIIGFEFPCDFDALLEMSSGVLYNEKDRKLHKPSMVSIDPFTSSVFLIDGVSHGDKAKMGLGGTLNAGGWSNLNTIGDVPTEIEKWFHKRNEPLVFLHKENTNLRIIVPFNPKIHVGENIVAMFYTKSTEQEKRPEADFGSGQYLVTHVRHNIKIGEFSTTVYDGLKIGFHPNKLPDSRFRHQAPEKLISGKG